MVPFDRSHKFVIKQTYQRGPIGRTNEVNTSSNNPNLYFAFEDCFPTSLGAVEFVTDQTDVPYAVCDLTLRYTLFKIRTSS